MAMKFQGTPTCPLVSPGREGGKNCSILNLALRTGTDKPFFCPESCKEISAKRTFHHEGCSDCFIGEHTSRSSFISEHTSSSSFIGEALVLNILLGVAL